MVIKRCITFHQTVQVCSDRLLQHHVLSLLFCPACLIAVQLVQLLKLCFVITLSSLLFSCLLLTAVCPACLTAGQLLNLCFVIPLSSLLLSSLLLTAVLPGVPLTTVQLLKLCFVLCPPCFCPPYFCPPYFSLLFCPVCLSQLFGFANVFCNHIEGGKQACPPGMDCPSHRDCYVPCTESLKGQWFEVNGHVFHRVHVCVCEYVCECICECIISRPDCIPLHHRVRSVFVSVFVFMHLFVRVFWRF